MIVDVSRVVFAGLLCAATLGGDRLAGQAQLMPAPHPATPARPGAAGASGQHLTPTGWKFALPKGDPENGRQVFVKLECYSCHEVRGESFLAPSEQGRLGPELSQMAPLHEVEYFAEAIINPTAVIERGKGYEAQDGSSKMPSYNDSLTVQELVDLVAYLRALRPLGTVPAGQEGHGGHQAP